jgi:menaquinone-dependent protoporphyrinogen oxidase
MNAKILITYASQGGATAGVAEAIAKTLSTKNGALVDVRPVQEVRDLNPYRAVVIGSAVHSGKWMPEAMDFIARNQGALRRIPTAIFQVCMMLATGNEQYRRMVPGWLEPLRAQLRPVADGSFAGALWPDRYPKFSDKVGLKIFLASIKLRAGDYRNWDAIHAWAEGLYPLLVK